MVSRTIIRTYIKSIKQGAEDKILKQQQQQMNVAKEVRKQEGSISKQHDRIEERNKQVYSETRLKGFRNPNIESPVKGKEFDFSKTLIKQTSASVDKTKMNLNSFVKKSGDTFKRI